MCMRSLALRTGLRGLMEGTPSGAGRSSLSGLRYFSDSTGRILSEEERAKENVYIQKMERERLEKKKKKKAEKEKAEREKSGKIAEEEAEKI